MNMDTILIASSQKADTRTCDFASVTREDLFNQSLQHIHDVARGLEYFRDRLKEAAARHDYTKLTDFESFYSDFKSGFEKKGWWINHRQVERHHLAKPDGVRDDVDLVDVIEQIVDGVMAGMARSGEYRMEPLSDAILQRAYANTAQKLLANVAVMPQNDSRE